MARGQNYECSKCLSFNPALVMTKRTETIGAYDEMETMLVNLIGYDMKNLSNSLLLDIHYNHLNIWVLKT